jgi:uncharacterized protein YndB with AHSA1/START domain
MTRRMPRSSKVEATVPATIDAVWAVVSDVTRTGEWSHECRRLTWLDGATSVAAGARFRGVNRSGPWRWGRTCQVLAVEPPYAVSWRTIPTWRYYDSTDWSITLAPVDGGTRIVQTFQVTWCPAWWEWLVSRLVPAHLDRTAALTADLVRIGEVAASPTPQRSAGPAPQATP